MSAQKVLPTVVTIAGSDSGGGAGIQADVKTFTLLGCYGASVIVALTAQNGCGVRGIHAPDTAFVKTQLEAVLEGFPVRAAKTGMLFSSSIIKTVAAELAAKTFPLVVDPVAVSQSGHQLLEKDALDALIRYMLPLADLLTPNKPEAERLCGMSIENGGDIERAGKKLLAMGAKAVLIKGGHFDVEGDMMTDWLCRPKEAPLALVHKHIDTPNNHGTGCTLSAAIASFIALGRPIELAVRSAQAYLEEGLAASFNPGSGTGPVNFVAGARNAGFL